jgi:hypothetical protein
MTPEERRYRKHVERLCEYVRGLLYCEEYTYLIEFDDENTDTEDTAAEIDIDAVYLNYSLRFTDRCRRDFHSKKYRDLFETIVHEHCHLLTQPLYNWIVLVKNPNNAGAICGDWERQTQRVCNVIMALVPRSCYLPSS